MAVVFITRIENDKTLNEGICLKCARELGIKPVNDLIEKMGMTEEDFDRMNSEMEELAGQLEAVDSDDDADIEHGAPAVDFGKLLRNSGLNGMIIPPDPNAKQSSANSKNKKGGKNENKRKYLDTYCKNLTKAASDGLLDRIVGRERELDRVIQILCRRQKNNPCLIGEPGVGKTAIAEALAQKIARGDVPYRLQGYEVMLLDLTALVAGTQFRGQFESRVLGLLDEVKSAGNIILVIDEVHTIVGTGDSEGSQSAANILKPALSRGEIQIIGATTLNEYRKHIEKDAALERRFQPVTVDEPSIGECIEMLSGIKHYYEEFHAVKIPESVICHAVTLSERYITDRYLPDKAIDLLDEAASHISITSDALNESRKCHKELNALSYEKARLEGMGEPKEQDDIAEYYRNIAEIRSKEMKLEAKIAELQGECEKVCMTISDLADVIEIWTGIPASSISENEFKRLETLQSRIKARIIGQDKAVESVVRAVKRNRAGVSYKRKPISFIFAGPTGVGKTELVKVISEELFDSQDNLIRLDMTEFMEKHSVSRLIGSPPGYVGYDDAGQLTEKIRRHPYSVVLFDEIEKAHPDVLNILLQILDDGRVTDSHGKKVNFENTMIVMTTNAGSNYATSVSGFGEDEDKSTEKRTEKALGEFLRPEFINRIDEIITFRHLDRSDFAKIAAIMLSQLASALAEKGTALSFTDAAAQAIADGSYSEKFGARNMRRYIQNNIEDRLAEMIIASYEKHISALTLDAEDGKLTIIGA
jgi:ATP-dependent Clp protease ATP-binding subunit ClpC